MSYEILRGDCLAVLRTLPDSSFDSIVTDPPYELGFMGKSWDATGIANNVEMWREALRVLKPGGHLLAFSGSRTYHRMTCAIEDAGFEIRDQIMWVYGSGFPKSLDVSKAIDKTGSWIKDNGRDYVPTVTAAATDAARQWEGWGTALKPAHEPICVARKPLIGTVAANVLAHGTGALNIGACRVGETVETWPSSRGGNTGRAMSGGEMLSSETGAAPPGRWPANLIHDGSDEVLSLFPEVKSGAVKAGTKAGNAGISVSGHGGYEMPEIKASAGSAARFFYCAKASKSDRGPGNTHPTVKPLALMRYLLRLVTPPGGRSLDIFAGSGSTIVAGLQEGFVMTGIELTPEYADIAERRAQEEYLGDLI